MAGPLDTLPPSSHDNGNLRVVALRLDGLTLGVAELKGIMVSLDTRLRQLELDRVGAAALLEAKITSAHSRIDVLSKDVTEANTDNGKVFSKHDEALAVLTKAQVETDKQLGRFADAYRVLLWIGGVLMVSIIALIWSLVTGQARITF